MEAFCWRDCWGRKAYTKGSVIKWDVEIGSFSFDVLMTSLRNAINWFTTQCPVAWFYDKRLSQDVMLENQFQINDMFEMYKEEMHCHIVVGVFDQSIPTIDQFDELDLPPNTSTGNRASTYSYVNQPTFEADVAPEAKVETQLEPDREPDMFDNDEEFVGCDDEGMYMPTPPTQPSIISQPPSNSPPHASHDAENANADAFRVEAEVTNADPEEINIIHDPEHPKIVKGELFPDIFSFRKAIRHFSVTKGYVLAGIKTDPTRFIAKCKSEGCPWRIHASRLQNRKTMQVTVYSLVPLCKFYFFFT